MCGSTCRTAESRACAAELSPTWIAPNCMPAYLLVLQQRALLGFVRRRQGRLLHALPRLVQLQPSRGKAKATTSCGYALAMPPQAWSSCKASSTEAVSASGTDTSRLRTTCDSKRRRGRYGPATSALRPASPVHRALPSQVSAACTVRPSPRLLLQAHCLGQGSQHTWQQNTLKLPPHAAACTAGPSTHLLLQAHCVVEQAAQLLVLGLHYTSAATH